MKILNSLLAVADSPEDVVGGDNVFGTIPAPKFLGSLNANTFFGKLLDRIIQFLVIGAGLYALINLILAGYSFMSAGDDPKKVASAWAMIYQTLIGLAVAAGAFVLAAIFGELLFGSADFLLKPFIPTL